MIAPPLTPDQRSRIGRELLSGEQLLWAARPGIGSSYPAFGIWLFAVPWTAFALFWEYMALAALTIGKVPASDPSRWAAVVFPLFGLPFVLVGIAMLAAPFLVMRAQAQSVVAVTSRRILRITGTRSAKIQSVLIEQIGPITRSERPDGRGTLSIQTHSRKDSDGDRVTETIRLDGIPDVAAVERLILDRLRAA